MSFIRAIPALLNAPASLIAPVLLCALSTLPSAPAAARGDLMADKDACVLKIGPELMYFAGYQPAGGQRKFCENAPNVGETIFVFDYAAPELREMKAGFRILRETADGAETARNDGVTAASVAPRVYPNGTLSFTHVFAEPGDFVGVVTVDGGAGEHWTARFPFSVGKRRLEIDPYYLIAAAGVLAMILIITSRGSRQSPPISRTRI